MKQEYDVELEVDEDETEDMTIHLYCDGVKAILLHDEKLDKLSEKKNRLEDKLDDVVDKKLKCDDSKNFMNGALVCTAGMTALSFLTNAFENLSFTLGWGAIATTVFGINLFLRLKGNKLDNKMGEISDKFEDAKELYDDAIVEVAANNNEEKCIENLYV